MQFGQYKKSFSSLQLENNFFRILTLGLLTLVLILVVALLNKKTIVTLQPWTLARDAQVTETQASNSYMEAWGLALAQLIGNVTPGNVDFVGEQIKPLLSPKIYHETLDALQAGATQLREDRVAMRFEPLRVTYEKTTGMVFVYGYSFMRAGTSMSRETKVQRTYEFKLSISNYLPQIDHLTTYEGVPHTRDEMDRIENREQNAKERARKEAAIKDYQNPDVEKAKAEERLE